MVVEQFKNYLFLKKTHDFNARKVDNNLQLKSSP